MRPLTLWTAFLTLFSLAGCATTGGPHAAGVRRAEVGLASYYAPRYHGARTASGRIQNDNALTAAHRTLPFGSRVRVTNLRNGSSVVVTVIDRGPFVRGRIIDVSRHAARELGFLREGTARVRVEVLSL